jgi:hypothetical protein
MLSPIKLSRRHLLKDVATASALPPLEAMCNPNGTLYAAELNSGHGAGVASIDQLIAAKIGGDSRFRSLQIGVSQQSFGESIPRNLNWADRDCAVPPEMIPHKLLDRILGKRDEGWITRKRSLLDAAQEDASSLESALGKQDQVRPDEHLTSVGDMERAIWMLAPEYGKVEEPEEAGDASDWPRIAKLQSNLLAHALVTGQTRVAWYMLTRCQGLSRCPWLGYTAARHHDYTHADGKAPGSDGPSAQRIVRDICRWHAEEFAYLVAKLKSTAEGAGALLDNSCLVFIHEHAKANSHKNNGPACIVSSHAGSLVTGTHSKMTATIGDLYLTLADDVMGAGIQQFPTADRKLSGMAGA